ncbi:ribonuclease R [Thalassoglobus sp.]|uniref:ribonuclease R n=1 Tax=Thalassoglobus sp. TaxID=2795869 RepID=UPI003AA94F92
MTNLAKRIIEFVQRPGYMPMKPKSLAKKLGITKKKLAKFEAALEEAKLSGEIRFSDGGRIQPKAPRGSHLGIVHRIKSGDAFIILREPKPIGLTEDIFVERNDLKDAQNGDEVFVKLLQRRRSRGQRCGYVVEVVERATNVFVGTYLEEDESGWVQIDGKDYPDPIWVGDPGAKGVKEGDKVVIEMLRFPTIGQNGEGVLTKVLGARGEPGVDTQMIIHEFGIPDEFPEEVLNEARLEAENFNENDLTDREDLSGTTVVTIDPKTARDFDDAISLKKIEKGHWLLGVHIADVSHFVQPGTQLDREAETRGTSVYLPTKVIPMLPEIISNGLASLQEGRTRFTMSAFIEFSAEGIPIETRFSRSAIKVTQRFAYEEVMPIIKAKPSEPIEGVSAEIRELLNNMHELAMILRKRRFAKGSLELDMPEVRLSLDADGKVTGAFEAEHDESHEIIEEFMLAANIAVAVRLNDEGIGFLRRAHADPAEAKLKAFSEFVTILGFELEKYQSKKHLQALLRSVRGTPQEQAVNYAMLRSLKQAEYSPMEVGHYALAEDQYCHFTSPIRRYPDLHIHRLVSSLVCDNVTYRGASAEDLIRLGHHCSTTERRAERAERELTKMKLLTYFEERVGEKITAVITGVERFGFFCRGIEIPAEGLVHISNIPASESYEFDRQAMALVGRRTGDMIRLGDKVIVEIASVDVDRRELNFKLLTHTASKPPAKKGASKSRPSTTKKDSKKPNSKQGKPRNQKSSTRKKKPAQKRRKKR